MDLFTEFLRRLSTELAPFWKWAISHWPAVLLCLIAIALLMKYWNKGKS
jgi:hypothetical protein